MVVNLYDKNEAGNVTGRLCRADRFASCSDRCGQRAGRAKEELLALCADTFYRKGVWRGEKVFERDGKGRVVRMLDRRENNDIVWSRVR
jgi:hypothetical protein